MTNRVLNVPDDLRILTEKFLFYIE